MRHTADRQHAATVKVNGMLGTRVFQVDVRRPAHELVTSLTQFHMLNSGEVL